MKTKGLPNRQRIQKHLLTILEKGHVSFSTRDYTTWCNLSVSLAQSDRKTLRNEKIITPHGDSNYLVFNIFLPAFDGVSFDLPELRTRNEVDNYLLMLECAGGILEYKLSLALMNALEKNQTVYDEKSWIDLFSYDKIIGGRSLERASQLGICTCHRENKLNCEITINPMIFEAFRNIEKPVETLAC